MSFGVGGVESNYEAEFPLVWHGWLQDDVQS